MKRNAKKQILFPDGLSVKVVIGGAVDPYFVEMPPQKTPFRSRDQYLLVDLGRVVLRPSDIVVALPRIDQNPFRAAYAAQVVLAGDEIGRASCRERV